MTDPYEYLLKKLNISIALAPGCEFLLQLKVNNQFVSFFPSKGSAEDIYSELHVLGETYKLDYWSPDVKPVVKTILLFPKTLESQEHVDILLTLNGLTEEQVMDPYEYLLNKFNVFLRFRPEFNTRSLYIKLETGEKLIANHIQLDWTHEKIYKFFRNLGSNEHHGQYDKEIDFISKFFRNLYLNEDYRHCNKELYVFCQQLRLFPDELESTEYVDLLLTLQGMNKGA